MTSHNGSLDEIIASTIEKSKKLSKEIPVHISNGFYSTAVNRIYYCCFYILTALALKSKFKTTKHGQLIGWFNKQFVKTGRIDKSMGEFVLLAFDMRSDADYGDFTAIERQEAESLYSSLQSFIDAIEAIIKKA